MRGFGLGTATAAGFTLLLLAGCGSSGNVPVTPVVSGSPSPVGPVSSRYPTPKAIMAVVTAHGLSCTDYFDEPSNTGVPYSDAVSGCTMNGSVVRFDIFATQAGRDTFVATMRKGAAVLGCVSPQTTPSADSPSNSVLILEGGNWLVESDDDNNTLKVGLTLGIHPISLCS